MQLELASKLAVSDPEGKLKAFGREEYQYYDVSPPSAGKAAFMVTASAESSKNCCSGGADAQKDA